ncbi:MAG: hypothetical protein JXA04_01310 [Gammaproteobacteria bacterium]|nr:hypothetical protein [Gammaproteobacteria bacterium]
MKTLSSGPDNQQTGQDWNAGCQLYFEGDVQYWQAPARPVLVYVQIYAGGEKTGVFANNNQTLTITPNVSSTSTYSATKDLINLKASWVHNAQNSASALIGPILMPGNYYLKLIATSSDGGDTAITQQTDKIIVIDASPGDVDFITGAAADDSGTEGLLDVNVVEVGGATPSTPTDAAVAVLEKLIASHSGVSGSLAEFISDIKTLVTAVDTLTKVAGDGDLAAIKTLLEFCKNWLEGDSKTDKTNPDQYQLFKTIKGTDTELGRKNAFDIDDNAITDTTTAIAKLEEPA